MNRKRITPIIILLAWVPFLSASAAGEGAAKPETPTSANAAGEGVASFKATISTISHLYRKLEYEQAFDFIHLARQRPLGTSALVLLSLYEGIILYELGRHVESGDAFQMALLIQPDAKLPELVAPKIEEYFEALRRRVGQELDSGPAPATFNPAPSTSASASSQCPPSRLAAKGRTLKAQQLWRLAKMEQMLCTRGIRGDTVAETLSVLRAQVMAASTSTEWMRLGQDIDRFSQQYAVYPSNGDWHQAKSSVPEKLWEVGDEDQDIPLPEAPIESVVKPLEEEPVNLFGCRVELGLECERLMRRLLLLQNQTLGMNAETRHPARRELFRLGQTIREARSNETLEEAAQDIDAWTARWH
jgi:tetratricopeptide (TPR) repeat protein